MRYSVYKHIAPNGKVYIGITSRNPVDRWKNGTGYKNNAYFTNAILKYGWENIKHEILFTDLTKDEACKKEIELISQYKSNDKHFGYNISNGGEGSVSVSAITREKMRKSAKGNRAHFGKKHTEEAKKKMSEAAIRRFENKEERAKQSERRKGSTAWNKGLKYTEEMREKISMAHKGLPAKNRKGVQCIETGIVYVSTYEAAKAVGKSQSMISEAARGKKKTAGGFHWEFKEVANG